MSLIKKVRVLTIRRILHWSRMRHIEKGRDWRACEGGK